MEEERKMLLQKAPRESFIKKRGGAQWDARERGSRGNFGRVEWDRDGEKCPVGLLRGKKCR